VLLEGAAMVDSSQLLPPFSRKTAWIAVACLVASATGDPARAQCDRNNPQAVEFSVHVTDFQYENPIDQARVDLVRLPDEIVDSQFTDSKGDVGFSCVRPGTYVLRSSKDGYAGVEVQVSFRQGETQGNQIPLRLWRAGPAERPRSDSKTVSARTLAIPEGPRKEFETGITFLNQKKDPKGSLQHFEKAIAAYPGYYEAYFLAGMAHLQLKQPGDAQTDLAQAIKLNSKFLEPYYPLATLLMAKKEYAEAERLLHEAQDLDPDGWQWPFELARSEAYQNQWDHALAYAEMALKRANAPPKVHLLMADLYEDTGSPGKAIEELEQFEKLDPNSPYMPRVKTALAQLRGNQSPQ
jgi:predicted Zn-dependent protease